MLKLIPKMTKQTKIRAIFVAIILIIMLVVFFRQAGVGTNYGTEDCTAGFRDGRMVYDSCLVNDPSATCIPIKYVPQNGYQELPGKCNRGLK